MSKEYTDIQCLDLDNNSGNSKVFKMSNWSPPPSSRLLTGLCSLCAVFLLLIIILIVALRNSGASDPDRSLEYKLGNLSVSVNSRIDRLSQDDSKIMDKIKEIDGSVLKIDKSVEKIISDKSAVTLQSEIQRVISGLGKLVSQLKKLQVNGSLEDSCPDGWTYFTLSCYYVSKVGKSWDDAKKLCETKESHLVVINSDAEQDYVTSIAKQQYTWIGLTDASEDWKWIDGTIYQFDSK
ncbi:Hypothetical predicted protein [Pelobates cultripes]|uniref:C-type lectin domain-containing protein n=2 Tax=Pelobates cultripes TaxID=61616 RepID=A0AAD1RIF1_PELCU|nr:Hypothetical predicted protein [Pelobates cultripes]